MIAFLLATLCIAYISRASLRSFRSSHGFYRFFAWETIILLFLMNVEYWFKNPLAWNQILAWILLFGSLIPLIAGVKSLTRHGNPTDQRQTEPELLAFEKTTTLVTTGIYRYIRHPLYSSLLLLTWGIFFKQPNWRGILLSLIATAFLIGTAKSDERECLRYFGDAYEDYKKQTMMFLPYLF